MSTTTRRLAASTALAAAIVAIVAGCSGGTANGGAPHANTLSAAAQADGNGGQGDTNGGQAGEGMSVQRTPGVNGKVAALTGSVAQVQDTSSQTAVTFDASTSVTKQVDATLADVTVGSCIVAFSESDGGVATSVAITQPGSDGTCAMGGMDGGPQLMQSGQVPGDMPSGMPDGMPDGMPSGMPDDMPSGAAGTMPGGMPSDGTFTRAGSVVAGTVTKVDGTTITVEPTAQGAQQDGTAATTATVDDATTYSATQAADISAITVGVCVNAQGTYDDKGGLTASSVKVSQPDDSGSCTAGMGGAFTLRHDSSGTTTDGGTTNG